ncbi:unnamed protein product [Rotaria sp. Silwood2]|nr:unnamed protein product [Rotaria sp. Silwood2]
MGDNQREQQLLKTKIIFLYFNNVLNNNNFVVQNYSVNSRNDQIFTSSSISFLYKYEGVDISLDLKRRDKFLFVYVKNYSIGLNSEVTVLFDKHFSGKTNDSLILENTNELDSKINTLMNEIKKQEETNNTSNMHLTDADKEKGAFKNFNISKRTIKKLQAPRILVLAPTRELTKQILDDFQSINSIRNDCDILVATPGRLKDIVDKGKLDLTKIKHVILDEVDRMLDMGFIDDVEEILEHIFTPSIYLFIKKEFKIKFNLFRSRD